MADMETQDNSELKVEEEVHNASITEDSDEKKKNGRNGIGRKVVQSILDDKRTQMATRRSPSANPNSVKPGFTKPGFVKKPFNRPDYSKPKEEFVGVSIEVIIAAIPELKYQLEEGNLKSGSVPPATTNILRNLLNTMERATALCHFGKDCDNWYCKFSHHGFQNREKCFCKNDKCVKFHVYQALCRNPNHEEGCKMRHEPNKK